MPPGGPPPAPNQLFDHVQCRVHASLIFCHFTLITIFLISKLFLWFFPIIISSYSISACCLKTWYSYDFVYCFEHLHYTNFNTFEGPYLALEFLKHLEFWFSDLQTQTQNVKWWRLEVKAPWWPWDVRGSVTEAANATSSSSMTRSPFFLSLCGTPGCPHVSDLASFLLLGVFSSFAQLWLFSA